MNKVTRDLDAESLEECEFWKKFSGEVRRPAVRWPSRVYLLGRVLLRGATLALRYLTREALPPPETGCEILLVYVTENQRRAFLPWIGMSPSVQTASQMRPADWLIPWSRCGWLMLRQTWHVYRMLGARADRALLLPWLEEFVRYRVGVVLAAELYARTRPAIVVVSNDHSGLFRAFIRIAREQGRKVVYTQHASIGRNFPPLNFDLSLLDGAQAFLRYQESGVPRGCLLITGRNRPEPLAKRPDTVAQRDVRVGLATNWDDALLDWLPILRTVAREFSSVTLRCHPAETRRIAWRILCALHGVEMDSGSLREFLARVSVLISGTSGVVLDAALSHVPSLVKLSELRTSPDMIDYFGYGHFGISVGCSDVRELPRLIRERVNQPVELERVGAFEAGLVDEPVRAKRAALALFASCVRESRDVQAEFESVYTSVLCGNSTVLMSREYAFLNAKFGWLVGDGPETDARGK